jgi:hypothetical protein
MVSTSQGEQLQEAEAHKEREGAAKAERESSNANERLVAVLAAQSDAFDAPWTAT